ncbi:sodium- and chloride-dependent betaine transporter-like [Ylistrum balloti]|uniref:sodium- and chloride-dependent betaine transporter-like n=1 Tax=Ylistrum balloti TaxID=509963 RepID=UPI002905ECEB|nr:sodium- and chloride-dependent betaine transporter-like [Ylistrum balloti]
MQDSHEEVQIDLLSNGKKRFPSGDASPERDVWERKIEYLFSLIGYTVGLGSLWRFPYLCMKNGGGAFLIPFTFFMVTCGFPLYYLELLLGQFSGKSPMVVWNICPLFKGLGFMMVFVSLVVTWYIGVVLAWVLYYLGYSFATNLPWSSCDNEWNTDQCVVFRTVPSASTNVSDISNNTYISSLNSTFRENRTEGIETSAKEFWRYKVLNISNGIDEVGTIQWHTVLVLLLAYALSFVCIVKGVKSVGKVVYVTATLPYLLLTVILVRSLTLDGAVDGIIYYIKPDFSRLMHFQVWFEAALQVFYSLGPSWGGVLTMASFNRFHNKCLGDAILVVFMDLFTAFYCGFVVFSIVGFLAHKSGMKVDEVVEAGPGLIFLTYPEALIRLPLPHMWSVLFFVMVVFVGIDSQFGLLETIVSGLVDMYPKTLGKHKLLVLSILFLFYVVTSLIFASQAGVYVFKLIDWYIAAYCIFLGSLLECVVIAWLYGAERFSRDVELMTGRSVHILIRWSWYILVPIAMFISLILVMTNMTSPSSKEYTYPSYIGIVGNMIGILPILPIPLFMLTQLLSESGTLKQRIKNLVRPSPDWGPNNAQERETYVVYEYSSSMWQNMRVDLFGQRKKL